MFVRSFIRCLLDVILRIAEGEWAMLMLCADGGLKGAALGLSDPERCHDIVTAHLVSELTEESVEVTFNRCLDAVEIFVQGIMGLSKEALPFWSPVDAKVITTLRTYRFEGFGPFDRTYQASRSLFPLQYSLSELQRMIPTDSPLRLKYSYWDRTRKTVESRPVVVDITGTLAEGAYAKMTPEAQQSFLFALLWSEGCRLRAELAKTHEALSRIGLNFS